jgi:hypothetical protein
MTFWFVAQCLNHYATACPFKRLHNTNFFASTALVQIQVVIHNWLNLQSHVFTKIITHICIRINVFRNDF